MWSKITIAAVVIMLAGGFFFYQNHGAIQVEENARDKAQTTLNATNANIEEEINRIKELENEIASLKAACDELDRKHAELVETNERTVSEIAQKTADLEDISRKLADIEQRSAGMKNVAQLAAEIQRTEEDNNRLTAELAALTARKDALVARGIQVDKNIEALNQLEADQRARISPAGLRTTIQTTDPSWNFVIINGGADKGIVLGSKLAVVRAGEKVAELNVNNVEQSRSTADIVPGSSTVGFTPMPGDIIESIRPADQNT